MDSNESSDAKSKDDELESKKAQEVIGLLLSVSMWESHLIICISTIINFFQ